MEIERRKKNVGWNRSNVTYMLAAERKFFLIFFCFSFHCARAYAIIQLKIFNYFSLKVHRIAHALINNWYPMFRHSCHPFSYTYIEYHDASGIFNSTIVNAIIKRKSVFFFVFFFQFFFFFWMKFNQKWAKIPTESVQRGKTHSRNPANNRNI